MADKKQKLRVVEELRTLDEKGLLDRINKLRVQLVEQQRSHAAQELPNVHVISKTRKEIAKALTILGEHTRHTQAAQKEEDK